MQWCCLRLQRLLCHLVVSSGVRALHWDCIETKGARIHTYICLDNVQGKVPIHFYRRITKAQIKPQFIQTPDDLLLQSKYALYIQHTHSTLCHTVMFIFYFIISIFWRRSDSYSSIRHGRHITERMHVWVQNNSNDSNNMWNFTWITGIHCKHGDFFVKNTNNTIT